MTTWYQLDVRSLALFRVGLALVVLADVCERWPHAARAAERRGRTSARRTARMASTHALVALFCQRQCAGRAPAARRRGASRICAGCRMAHEARLSSALGACGIARCALRCHGARWRHVAPPVALLGNLAAAWVRQLLPMIMFVCYVHYN